MPQPLADHLLDDYVFISAKEYLALYPEAGVTRLSRPFNVPYSVVYGCICAGQFGQVIFPPSKDGKNFILTDSFYYQYEPTVMGMVVSSALLQLNKLEGKGKLEELEEAAPLYSMWNTENIWHWLFESLPKLVTLEHSGYKGPYIANSSTPFIPDSLRLMGISTDRLVYCGGPFFVNKTVIPHPARYEETSENAFLFPIVRERLLSGAGVQEGAKRCFIRRIGTRRLLNEEELLDTLKAYDISVLVPEEHSLREQIAFMSNAELTLSPHGANTALAFFQKKNSVLMEFFGCDHIHNHCNLHTIDMLKLLYIPITERISQNVPFQGEDTERGLRNYHINVKLVATILENIRTTQYKL